MSDDLIRRSDAIKAIKEHHFFINNQCKYPSEGCVEVIEDAINVPSADRTSGEWITTDTEVISVPVYWNEEQRQSDERGAGILEKCECSVCGWRTNFMGYKKLGVDKPFNYCPNCGSRMKGADDE